MDNIVRRKHNLIHEYICFLNIDKSYINNICKKENRTTIPLFVFYKQFHDLNDDKFQKDMPQGIL